jgi:hypothetical protein
MTRGSVASMKQAFTSLVIARQHRKFIRQQIHLLSEERAEPIVDDTIDDEMDAIILTVIFH